MWRYEKRLQYPVKISQPNPKMAQFIMSQYGGPDGEMGASMRYLSQRYAMPYDIAKASLTDIGTEELAHLEIVAAIVHQLTRNLTPQEIEDSGFIRGSRCRTESPEHLRQHSPRRKRSGSLRSNPLSAGKGSCAFPAFWRNIATCAGSA